MKTKWLWGLIGVLVLAAGYGLLTKMLGMPAYRALVVGYHALVDPHRQAPAGTQTVETATRDQSLTLKQQYRRRRKESENRQRLAELMSPSQIDSLVTVRTKDEVSNRRKALIQRIYGSETDYTTSVPHRIERVSEVSYQPRDSSGTPTGAPQVITDTPHMELFRIDGRMPYSVPYRIHYFRHPAGSENLILYHQGHQGTALDMALPTLLEMFEDGYDVAAFTMPLLDRDLAFEDILISHPRYGTLEGITTHDELQLLDDAAFSAIHYFVAPLSEFLNALETPRLARSYGFTTLTGVSGGGWTTTLYAALDERIDLSASFGGTLPMYARASGGREFGDWEQYGSDIYRIVNYLDLYVMAAMPDRHHFQVHGQFDSCCFWAYKAESYAPVVTAVSRAMGGNFGVVVMPDETRHQVIYPVLKDLITNHRGTVGAR